MTNKAPDTDTARDAPRAQPARAPRARKPRKLVTPPPGLTFEEVIRKALATPPPPARAHKPKRARPKSPKAQQS